MKNDRSQSWIVISRRLNKYVNELPEENGKSFPYEEAVTVTERPVATKQKEPSTPPLPSLSRIVVPIDHRKWKDIPAVDNVDKGSLSSVSKTMTRIRRHRGLHRETDVAMEPPQWSAALVVAGAPSTAVRAGKRGADQPRSPNRGFLGMWGPVGFWEGTPDLHDSE